MARSRSTSRVSMKPVAYALLALAAGVALLIASRKVKTSDKPPVETATTVPATAPAPGSQDEAPSRSREEVAAQNLSGMLLLFSMGGFLVAIICIGWLVVLIRKARPAWKTQTKYPRMR